MSTHSTWAPPPPVAPTGGSAGRRGAGKGRHATEIRAQQALEALSRGATYRQVVGEIMQLFRVSVRTAERDLQRAQRMLTAEHAAERPTLRAKIETRLWRLSKAAEDEGHYSAAIRALYVIGRLAGLDQVQVTTATDPVTEKVLGMTPQEREARLAELLRRRMEAMSGAPSTASEPEPARPPPRDRAPGFDPRAYARGRR